MSKSWAWITPYICAILAMLLAGPLLSNLAVAQSISIPYVPLNGSHAIRLIANLLALAILWTLAFAASFPRSRIHQTSLSPQYRDDL